MRTSLKYLGWLVGTAAGVSLCITLRNQRLTQTTLDSVPMRPRRSRVAAVWDALKSRPSSEIGHAARCTRPSAKTSTRSLEISPHSDNNRHARDPAPSETRSQGVPYWIATILLSATAVVSLYCGAMLRKAPAVPPSSLDSTTVAQTNQMPPDDYRPSVDLLQAVPQPLSSNGGGFTIKLYNSGKRPALDVRIQDIIRIADLNQEPDIPQLESAPVLAVGTMLPEADFSTQVGFRASPLTVAALREGRARVINYLLLTFEDQSHRSHTVRQCFYWHSGLQAPDPCPNNQRTD